MIKAIRKQVITAVIITAAFAIYQKWQIANTTEHLSRKLNKTGFERNAMFR